jgi:hypothetical protein
MGFSAKCKTTFDELLENYKQNFKGQRYYKTKSYFFPVLEKYFGGKLLSDITPYDLELFRNDRKNTPVKSKKDDKNKTQVKSENRWSTPRLHAHKMKNSQPRK